MNFTGATAGYQAGVQANDTRLAYAREATYGVAPKIAYQRLRLTGENFRRQNDRQRPEEIDPHWEASQAVTTQQTVGGTLSGALSFGSYDALFACVCSGNTVDQTVRVPNGTELGFERPSWEPRGITISTWKDSLWGSLPLAGFTRLWASAGKINRVIPYRRTSPDYIIAPFDTFDALPATVTDGGTASASVITNDAIFNSVTLIEQLGDDVLVRTGGFVKQIQLSIAQGQFATFSADFDFRDEQRLTTSPATDLLAPTDSFVLDPVSGWGAIWIDGKKVDAPVRQFSATLTRDGAGQDFALGSVAAVGQRPGSLTATGQIQIFFRNSTEYQRFQDNWQGPVQVMLKDIKGNIYGLTFFSSTLQNPQVNAASKNSTIVATFDIEGNPKPGGGTFSLSIFPA
ncbi:phage tail tube protein [Asaia sp. HN010]|uniref:phage tail tube protein n=1 Tax=Asaia sp. HN010 TaxID=3081233 RepID=UPI0030192EC2